jgi:hypothetical protein
MYAKVRGSCWPRRVITIRQIALFACRSPPLEPVAAIDQTRCRGDRCDPAQHRPLRFGGDSLRVVAGGDEQVEGQALVNCRRVDSLRSDIYPANSHNNEDGEAMDRRAKWFRGAVAAATVTVAAVAFVDGPPAAAIESGDVVEGAMPWAAYVTTTSKFLFTQTKEGSCSGFIIADRWVLTAAHCLYFRGKQVQTSKLKIVLGRDDLTATWRGGQWSVVSAIVHPDYDDTKAAVYDLALLQLDGALPPTALPLPIAPRGWALPDQATATAWGYGNVSETYKKRNLDSDDPDYDDYSGTASSRLRRTRSEAYRHDAQCSGASAWCLERTGTSSILRGDSGGPWTAGDANPFVVGVSSVLAGAERTSDTTVSWGYAGVAKVSEPGIHDWIDSNVGLIEANPGTIYRNADTAEAFYAGTDGFVSRIPTGGDYLCFEAQGAPVTNLPPFLVAMLPKTDVDATCTPDSESGGLLAGDVDNFGYGDQSLPCVFYDLSEPEDLGVFDRELVDRFEVDRWTHDFRNQLPTGFTTATLSVEILEAFSDDDSPTTISFDGITFDFIPNNDPASCGPGIVRTFVLTGQDAAIADDGVIEVEFREEGDDIALDYARVRLVGTDGTVVG